MAGERLDALTGRSGPDLDLLVIRAGDNQVASELDTRKSAVMPLEGAQAFTRGYVPEHDLAISRRTDDLVVLEPYSIDGAVVSR